MTPTMERIPQLVEKVKRLQAERETKVAALDEAIEAAEGELADVVAEVRGSLDEALGAIGKRVVRNAGKTTRGQLMALVAPLLGKMTAEEMAKELDRPVASIKKAVARVQEANMERELAETRRRPTSDAPAAPGRPVALPSSDRAVVGSPPPAAAPRQEDVEPVDVEALRKNVLVRMGRGSKVRLLTSARLAHKHIADVNRDGNGFTLTAGKDGHVHAIKGWVIGAGPDGHRHDLTTEAA